MVPGEQAEPINRTLSRQELNKFKVSVLFCSVETIMFESEYKSCRVSYNNRNKVIDLCRGDLGLACSDKGNRCRCPSFSKTRPELWPY